ncbi:MAG: hypothetical protein ACE5GA_11350, partial [Candidatus Zixiibacteriota bacterium]
MKPEIQRKIAPQYLMALTLALILSPGAMAENYVNWGKKYGLAIPDDWRRIERSNVDVFLRAHDKDPKSMDYDAFFCPVDAKPFYSQA